MTRPTIAFVVPALAEGGGVPAVARFLVRAVERSGDFGYGLVSLATSAHDETSLRLLAPSSWKRRQRVREQVWEGRPVRHVGARFAELEFQRYLPRPWLSRILREFDLVQVVAGSPAPALVTRDFPGPVVLQAATLAAAERRERFRRERGPVGAWRRVMTILTTRAERRAVQLADRIFVENEWMRSTVSSWTDPTRVVLAPPGVDTGHFRPCVGSDARRGGPGYLLSVGRFGDPRKNVECLFEAYARLREQLSTCPPLVLAGKSEPGPSAWAAARRLGVRDTIAWRGEVGSERLAALYRGAHLFVLSSSEEGLGLVLLEAMASGLPVVATATQGARHVVEHERTGLLVPCGDAVALARAMAELLSDAARADALGRWGRELVEHRYSERTAAKPFLDAYIELLARAASCNGVHSSGSAA